MQSAQNDLLAAYLDTPANKASRKGADTMRAAVKKSDQMPSQTAGNAPMGGNK